MLFWLLCDVVLKYFLLYQKQTLRPTMVSKRWFAWLSDDTTCQDYKSHLLVFIITWYPLLSGPWENKFRNSNVQQVYTHNTGRVKRDKCDKQTSERSVVVFVYFRAGTFFFLSSFSVKVRLTSLNPLCNSICREILCEQNKRRRQ